MKKIIMALLCSVFVTTQCFAYNDVSNDLNNVIMELSEFGIINGYEDGTFRPDNNITRAEFSKMIICATGYNYFENEDNGEFVDVPNSHWGNEFIYVAKKFGIVNGTTSSTFEPESNITYEQAIKMIVCSLGYGNEALDKGGYPSGYIQVANDLGITQDINFVQTDIATRKNIALIIDRALDIKYNYMYEFEGEIHVENSPLTLREQHKMRLEKVNYNDGVFEATYDE